MPSIAHLHEPLAGAAVQIRDVAERDIPEVLIAYQDDPELHLRMGEERPPSGAELGRLADAEADYRAIGLRATMTILERGDVCCGQIDVHHLDWDHRRAELGIWLAPQVRGRGLASGALRLVGPWLLDQGLLRLQILAEPENAPMLHAAQAARFRPEGVLRGYKRGRGRRLDCAVLSLLPTDLER
jgi:RimJ/RimL family protein N-acetyltransferase